MPEEVDPADLYPLAIAELMPVVALGAPADDGRGWSGKAVRRGGGGQTESLGRSVAATEGLA
jgi:hypothetical protein